MNSYLPINYAGGGWAGDPEQQEAAQALIGHGTGILSELLSDAGREGLAEDIETYGPVVASTVSVLQSPERQVGILRNRLATAERLNLPEAFVGRIRAQLAAAESALARERESDEAASKFRELGTIASYVGIGVGVSLIILFMSRAFRR